jgi:acetylornithine deacetylase/succinyl-diaminopimelate desuccinylase-like protein
LNHTELCRKLVSIDSSQSHGTKDIAEYVSELATGWGLTVDLQHESYLGVNCANVIIRPKVGPAEHELALISTLDTPVPGEYGHWVKTGANPFNASVDGDWIYGLGVAYAKADFACKLLALKSVSQKNFKNISPVVVGSFGQSSGAGAIRLIRKKQIKPMAVLASAPTQLKVGCRAAGHATVEISIPYSDEEKKSHEKHNLSEASVSQNKIFTRGKSDLNANNFFENPILKLIDYLKNLPEGISILSVEGGSSLATQPEAAMLEIELVDGIKDSILPKLVRVGEALKKLSMELKAVTDPSSTPNHSTITIGQIRTDNEVVKISGVCQLVPAKGRDVYEKWLEVLRQDCDNTGASFHIIDYKPPFITDNGRAFAQTLKSVSSDLNLGTDDITSALCTEANVFHRLGVDSAVFGPGDHRDLIQAYNEKVSSKELITATEFYSRLIERVCK